MQFPTILVIAALATGVISSPTPYIQVQKRNMHSAASCSTGFNKETDSPIFNDEITAKACEAYRQDITGTEDGEQCNDCTVVHNIIPGTTVLCGSISESIGGVEVIIFLLKHPPGLSKQELIVFNSGRDSANNLVVSEDTPTTTKWFKASVPISFLVPVAERQEVSVSCVKRINQEINKQARL
ncbi:hypothetical protein HYFRA_00005797 [Hymenoscyphus fraxineus]|uniref:Uncharacterized protein n=1 Tax=Hymenoscyphus fraxineus TaxID=746836 RepID=A0A9N9KZ87_9HELO|nr:hypothetical protein HYFRA_00005797 [Hymenoscyphus fraxineus]